MGAIFKEMGNLKSPSNCQDSVTNSRSAERLNGLIERFSRVRVLVIGDFILDEFVWGSVDRISPEAPVPVVKVERESFLPGGALNVANNIRTLGGYVIPCGVVGRDLRGRMLVKTMRKLGIDTRGVMYDPLRPTTLKTRVIAHSQQVVRFDREVTSEINPAQIRQVTEFAKKAMSSADAVAIEDYGKGVIHPRLLREILALAKSLRKPIVVDPKEKHISYYRGASVITPNRKEALGAYGISKNGRAPDIERVGKTLLKRLSLGAVLITLGEEGMILFEKNGSITRIPTAARQVYDVSGAGDTVVAVFAMAIAAGASYQEAAVISNKAAGIVVGKLGTATVTKEELKSALTKNKKTAAEEKLVYVQG